jgi:hypothetical protein
MSASEQPHWPVYEVGAPIPGTDCAVVQTLGSGGQAEVYLVRQTFIEKLAVMKLWKANALTDASFRDFRGEAIKQGAMRHDNIVSVVGGGMTGESPRRPYFMMEYFDGYTLQRALEATRRAERAARTAHLERLAEGQPSAYRQTWISVRNACELCIQLCDALTYAHVEHGLIHRDIKPANIFLVNAGFNRSQVKLFDFGIAKLIDEALARPDNAFYGSLTHCAPEQLEGRAYPQTDLYAMTLVLYELLTASRAFPEAREPMAYVQAALHGTPLAPSERMRGISPALDRFVLRNLSKRPDQRSASAREYAKELTSILDAYREEDFASDPDGGQGDGPTSRMPFQQVLAMSAGMMDEHVARAKQASYWDSAKGITVTAAADEAARAALDAEAVEVARGLPPHAGPTGTTPMAGEAVTRAAREALDEARREEALAANRPARDGSAGDTSPSVGVVHPGRKERPGPMSLASRRATTEPMREAPPPPTDPMRDVSHLGYRPPIIREASPARSVRASSTKPMADAPGRVNAPRDMNARKPGSLAGTASPPSRFYAGTSRTSFAQRVIVGTGVLLIVSFGLVLFSLRGAGRSGSSTAPVQLPPSPIVTASTVSASLPTSSSTERVEEPALQSPAIGASSPSPDAGAKPPKAMPPTAKPAPRGPAPKR